MMMSAMQNHSMCHGAPAARNTAKGTASRSSALLARPSLASPLLQRAVCSSRRRCSTAAAVVGRGAEKQQEEPSAAGHEQQQPAARTLARSSPLGLAVAAGAAAAVLLSSAKPVHSAEGDSLLLELPKEPLAALQQQQRGTLLHQSLPQLSSLLLPSDAPSDPKERYFFGGKTPSVPTTPASLLGQLLPSRQQGTSLVDEGEDGFPVGNSWRYSEFEALVKADKIRAVRIAPDGGSLVCITASPPE